MPVLPVPLIIALLLLGFLLHRLATRDTPVLLLALIGFCALQSATLAAVQYYGLSFLRVLQPLCATIIPAVAWLAFCQATAGTVRPRDIALHAVGPVAAALSLLIYPEALDTLIPIAFAAYGGAMLVTLSRGEDSLPYSRLENGGLSLLVWRVLAIALLASAATDIIIAARLASGDATVLLWLPSVFSSATLLILGALSLSHAIESHAPAPEASPPHSPEEEARDDALLARLEAYVAEHRPYLDPDLTLARLARKVRVPEKQLSAAINNRTGANVSRYINGHRVRHACALMAEGQSVTNAMLASGFNTKSNFNREFLRVMGQSPKAWLRSRVAASK